MNKQDLLALGITEEDVLDRLTERILSGAEGDDGYRERFESLTRKAVKEQVDAILAKAVEDHILPRVAETVDNLTLEETNKWGEKKGTPPATFIEYLVQRAESYIREEVNYNGFAKGEERDSYNWSKSTTRIAYMINKHLHYSIDTAMKKALGEVDGTVRKGLEDAVKIALANIKLTVQTQIK